MTPVALFALLLLAFLGALWPILAGRRRLAPAAGGPAGELAPERGPAAPALDPGPAPRSADPGRAAVVPAPPPPELLAALGAYLAAHPHHHRRRPHSFANLWAAVLALGPRPVDLQEAVRVAFPGSAVGLPYARFLARVLIELGYLVTGPDQRLQAVIAPGSAEIAVIRSQIRSQRSGKRSHGFCDRGAAISYSGAGAPGIARRFGSGSDSDQSRIEASESFSVGEADRICASTRGYLPAADHHRRCELRRAAGLRLPAATPAGPLLVAEAALRDLGAYPDKNRRREVVGWLFPDAASLAEASALQQAAEAQRAAALARQRAEAAARQEALAVRQASQPRPTPEAEVFWASAQAALRGRVHPASWDLYGAPIGCLSVGAEGATLSAPNKFLIGQFEREGLAAEVQAQLAARGAAPVLTWRIVDVEAAA